MILAKTFAFLLTLAMVLPSYAQPDGSLDANFGTAGKVLTNISAGWDYGTAIDIQQDGKIVVLSTIETGSELQYSIVRYLSNGQKDNSFGTNGITILPIDNGYGNIYGIDIKVLTNQKILLMLYDNTDQVADIMLTRLNTNGTLDETFGTGGYVNYSMNQYSSELSRKLFVLADGTILVYGRVGSEHGILKFSNEGILDTNFGQSGFKVLPEGSVKLAADGNFYMLEYQTDARGQFTRYNQDLELDISFGIAGSVDIGPITDPPMNGALYLGNYVVQADGKIIAYGISEDEDTDRLSIYVTRYLENGQADFSYGTNGLSSISFFEWQRNFPFDIRLLPNGKVLIYGSAYRTNPFTGSDFLLIRLTENGQLDNSFIFNDGNGNNGKVTTDFSGSDEAYDIAFQADGKIILAGVANNGLSDSQIALARYHNGSTSVGTSNLIAGLTDLSIYPSPVSNGSLLNLSFELKEKKSIVFRLINVEGQIVFSKSWKEQPAGLQQYQIQLPDLLPSQVYIARILNAKEEILAKSKLLIINQ